MQARPRRVEAADQPGHLEVIVGPMFSGKSAELVRRIRLAEIAQLRVQVFRPIIDTRAPDDLVVSRNGLRTPARLVASVHDLARVLRRDVQVIGIDEAQFFEDDLIPLVRWLVLRGRRVIVSGLDLDFAARPFGPMPTLLALADTVDKLTAVCMVCHSLQGTRTQRLVNGCPATEESPQVVIDAGQAAQPAGDVAVHYEARCSACYQPPSHAVAQLSYWPEGFQPLD